MLGSPGRLPSASQNRPFNPVKDDVEEEKEEEGDDFFIFFRRSIFNNVRFIRFDRSQFFLPAAAAAAGVLVVVARATPLATMRWTEGEDGVGGGGVGGGGGGAIGIGSALTLVESPGDISPDMRFDNEMLS